MKNELNRTLLFLLLLVSFISSCKKRISASPDAKWLNYKMGGVHTWTGVKEVYYHDSVAGPVVSGPVSVLYTFAIIVINDSVVVGSRINAADTLKLLTRNDYTNTLVFKGHSSSNCSLYMTFNYVNGIIIYDDFERPQSGSVFDLTHCRLYN